MGERLLEGEIRGGNNGDREMIFGGEGGGRTGLV